jgi:N-acetylglutamate synthase-like GNAT family acetyltransferase
MQVTRIYSNEAFIKQIEAYNSRMSLGYSISSIEDAPFDTINQLLHDSFQERLANNLNFDCASFTDAEYKEKASIGNIITIWDDDILVGTVYLGVHRRFSFIKCGFHEYLAVKSDNKNLGIGTMLQDVVVNVAKALNLDILLSSTAIPAISSVNWHKKNGFIPYKITSYEGRNYSSYNFIKPVSKGIVSYLLRIIAPIVLFIKKMPYKAEFKAGCQPAVKVPQGGKV